MTRISGKTYHVRRELFALGGRYNSDTQAWYVPDERAEEARGLLEIGRARANVARLPHVRPESQELTR